MRRRAWCISRQRQGQQRTTAEDVFPTKKPPSSPSSNSGTAATWTPSFDPVFARSAVLLHGLAPAIHRGGRRSCSNDAAPAAPAPQKLELAYTKPAVGAEVHATAKGPARETGGIDWDRERRLGSRPRFRGSDTETTAPSNSHRRRGQARRAILHPEDYGGVHEVIAAIDGSRC